MKKATFNPAHVLSKKANELILIHVKPDSPYASITEGSILAGMESGDIRIHRKKPLFIGTNIMLGTLLLTFLAITLFASSPGMLYLWVCGPMLALSIILFFTVIVPISKTTLAEATDKHWGGVRESFEGYSIRKSKDGYNRYYTNSWTSENLLISYAPLYEALHDYVQCYQDHETYVNEETRARGEELFTRMVNMLVHNSKVQKAEKSIKNDYLRDEMRDTIKQENERTTFEYKALIEEFKAETEAIKILSVDRAKADILNAISR